MKRLLVALVSLVAVVGCQSPAAPQVPPPAAPQVAPAPLTVRYGGAEWPVADVQAFDAFLAARSDEAVRPARDARLALRPDGTIEYVAAEEGVELDVAASRAAFMAALTAGKPSADLVTRPVAPSVPESAVASARDQLRRILPPDGRVLTLRRGELRDELKAADVAKLLRVEGGRSAADPARLLLDQKAVDALVKKVAARVDAPPTDVRLDWNGGDVRVARPSQDGRRLDRVAAAARLGPALLAGERELELPITPLPAAVTVRDPRALGIVEPIEQRTTSLAGTLPEKKWNVRVAAEHLDGVVVPPGGTFSFNDAMGPQTLENGFTMGYGLLRVGDSTRTVPTPAGGICQVASTLFHAVLWGGYQVEARRAHSFWNPTYAMDGAVGSDVAIDDVSGLDFKWVNTTDDYVLVEAQADDTQVTVALYGRKPGWKVDVSAPKVTNVRPADQTPLYEAAPSLPAGERLQVETARDGFDATITRTVTAEGAAPRTLTVRSSYKPSRNIVLLGRDAGRTA
jgi:vancomycin resistance protein YoaR